MYGGLPQPSRCVAQFFNVYVHGRSLNSCKIIIQIIQPEGGTESTYITRNTCVCSIQTETRPTSRGSAVRYFTCFSAKLDLMLATPGTRVRWSIRKRS